MATQSSETAAETLQQVCSESGVSLEHTEEACKRNDVGMDQRGNIKLLEHIREPNYVAVMRKQFVLGFSGHNQHSIDKVNSLLQTALSRWSDEDQIERFISNQLQ